MMMMMMHSVHITTLLILRSWKFTYVAVWAGHDVMQQQLMHVHGSDQTSRVSVTHSPWN